MRRIVFFALISLSCFFIGCSQSQTIKDSWKFTTRQYRTYLNTPANLDLEDDGSCEVYELALGEAVFRVDSELQKLIRLMENSDHNPDQSWVMRTLGRLPWLSGVALVDGQGNLVAQYPEYQAKPFDAKPLLEADPKQRMGALRAYVQMHADGPEVYVANPVFGGEELRGLIIAYFDPRALITMSPDPGTFALVSPAGVLWPGNYGGALGSHDWAEMLRKKSCGLVGASGAEFFWTTRYIGNLPLVYAVPTSASPTTPPPSREQASDNNAAPAAAPAISEQAGEEDA